MQEGYTFDVTVNGVTFVAVAVSLTRFLLLFSTWPVVNWIVFGFTLMNVATRWSSRGPSIFYAARKIPRSQHSSTRRTLERWTFQCVLARCSFTSLMVRYVLHPMCHGPGNAALKTWLARKASNWNSSKEHIQSLCLPCCGIHILLLLHWLLGSWLRIWQCRRATRVGRSPKIPWCYCHDSVGRLGFIKYSFLRSYQVWYSWTALSWMRGCVLCSLVWLLHGRSNCSPHGTTWNISQCLLFRNRHACWSTNDCISWICSQGKMFCCSRRDTLYRFKCARMFNSISSVKKSLNVV